MRTVKLFYTALILFGIVLGTNAQTQSSASTEIRLQGARFVNPLIEKWIFEYSRTHGNVKIELNTSPDQEPDASLQLIDEATVPAGEKLVFSGRYALLPVANVHNPLLEELERKGIDKKLLKKIYFEKDVFSDEGQAKEDQKWNQLTVYARNAQAGTSQLFAGYFGDVPTRLRGKKINGDDFFLVSALRRDSLGLSFNHLGYLYDLQSRTIKEGLLPLPIELGSGRKNKILINGATSLDVVIQTLQNEPSELIPTTRFAFRYKAGSEKQAVLEDFLKWVATEGQVYNNQFGILNLDAQTIAQQTKNWNESFITAR
ncbi:MAG: hypothetical protein QM786_01495 [Breznakibacter sp.]